MGLTWGGNGDDPDSEVDLYINDSYQASATTDNPGSGGSYTTFACPASGSYTWSVDSTVNGEPVSTPDQTMYCSPASGAGAGAAPRRASPSGSAVALSRPR